jgi:hypothetical protein
MIVISYFTENTPYEKEADKLKKSLNKFNLNYRIYGVESLGSWQRNTQMKPRIIVYALNNHQEDVLFVDADATFHARPEIFPIKCDFAAHLMDKAFWKQSTKKRTHSLMSGTLYFPYTEKAYEVLDAWQRSCLLYPDEWDQRCLEKVYKQFDFHNLPAEYCCIDRTMWGIENPVIRHHQASRRLKGKI